MKFGFKWEHWKKSLADRSSLLGRLVKIQLLARLHGYFSFEH